MLTDEQFDSIKILLSNQKNLSSTMKKTRKKKTSPNELQNYNLKNKKRAPFEITEQKASQRSLTISMQDEIKFLLTLFNAREFQNAMPVAERLTRTYPDNAFAWKAKGNILAELGEDALAIDSFNKAIKLGPNDRENFYNVGISYYTLGQFEQAEESFRKAIVLDPQYAGSGFCKVQNYHIKQQLNLNPI